jgi:gas vesicle protein
MSSGMLFISLLTGVATGASLGVLFAPGKGSVTRHNLTTKSMEYAEGLIEKFNEFLDFVSEIFDDVKEKVEKVKSKSNAMQKNENSDTR